MTSQGERHTAQIILNCRIRRILQTILAHYDCETMPKRYVAAGCDGSNESGLSLHKFPKNPVTRDQWSKEVA